MPTHRVFAGGYGVGKPVGVLGNRIPNYKAGFGDLDSSTEIDAPPCMLYYSGSKWIVRVHDYIPGPGPGDFKNEWDTPEQAVADILDYYFGDPSRMLRRLDES